MKLPRITQENVRMLLPAKIAHTVTMIAENRQLSSLDALLCFYQSRCYANLEREATKYWWMSPLQLYREFTAESSESSPQQT